MTMLHPLQRVFRPWVLVATGIVFNVFSAVITSHYIGINNRALHAIEAQKSAIQVRIDSQWQIRQGIERKKEFILLLLRTRSVPAADGGGGGFVYDYARNYLRRLIDDYGLTAGSGDGQDLLVPETVVAVTDQAKQRLLDAIDDIYLNRVLLEKRQQPLADRNSGLMSAALFLQIFGLILVLARDMQR